MRRNTLIFAAAALLSLGGVAQAQTPSMSGGRPALGFPLGDEKKAPEDPHGAEHESAYKRAMDKIPRKQTSEDPWQGVRSNSTSQAPKNGR